MHNYKLCLCRKNQSFYSDMTLNVTSKERKNRATHASTLCIIHNNVASSSVVHRAQKCYTCNLELLYYKKWDTIIKH